MANDDSHPLNQPLQESSEWKIGADAYAQVSSGPGFPGPKYTPGPAPVFPGGVIPCTEPSTAESVLREMVALLKDQLEAKRLWYESALEEEKRWSAAVLEKYNAQCALVVQLRDRIERLRIALAEAVLEVQNHNSEEDNPHRTDASYIDKWQDALSGE